MLYIVYSAWRDGSCDKEDSINSIFCDYLGLFCRKKALLLKKLWFTRKDGAAIKTSHEDGVLFQLSLSTGPLNQFFEKNRRLKEYKRHRKRNFPSKLKFPRIDGALLSFKLINPSPFTCPPLKSLLFVYQIREKFILS